MAVAVWIVAVAVASCIATFAARAYALRRKLIDEPGERRSHDVATPRGGGIGPVVVFATLLGIFMLRELTSRPVFAASLAGFLVVAAVGFWDDHRPLSALARLCVHVVAGVLLAAGFGLWSAAPVVAVGVVLMSVAMINIWNFMDGIDGIAASQALIVAGCAAFLLPTPWVAVALGFAAVCVGFLPANFPRAHVFMGDVGSGAFGFALAVLASACLLAPGASASNLPLLALPAAAFVTDSGLTLARRMVRGERWWTPHTQHLFQGASRRFGHVAVTLAYAGLSLAGAVVAAVNRGRPLSFTLVVAAVWYIASALLWLRLQHLTGQGSDASMEQDR